MALHRTRRAAQQVDEPIPGYVVNSAGILGQVLSATDCRVEVAYPEVYIDRDGASRAYMVVGDVWFDFRPAYLSDAPLYDEYTWDEAALTAAAFATALSA